MPIVQIQLLAGRSAAEKAALAAEVTSAVNRVLGSEPDRVQVLFCEVAGGDWFRAGTALRAGKAVTDASA
jgi:4-oxalocrotonate tautomerase